MANRQNTEHPTTPGQQNANQVLVGKIVSGRTRRATTHPAPPAAEKS